MNKLTKKKLILIENWIYENARPLEVSKWNLIWGKGTEKDILCEVLKYQNSDGGFGNALEADILVPQSSAIASAEAILTAFDFGLNIKGEWFLNLLNYFMKTKQNTPSYWEPVPKEIENYQRPPWWNYKEDTKFTPNPCAVVAAGMLLCGDEEKRLLGTEIAEKCIALLKSSEAMYDHDIYCMQRLFIALQEIGSDLIDEEVFKSMERRILSNVSLNKNEWMNYVAQPLDLVGAPYSPWYDLLKNHVTDNVSFWISNINEAGIWPPNFSWGSDTLESNNATKQWNGYIAVKRVKILKDFGFVEAP